jgi:hypothetical protein
MDVTVGGVGVGLHKQAITTIARTKDAKVIQTFLLGFIAFSSPRKLESSYVSFSCVCHRKHATKFVGLGNSRDKGKLFRRRSTV